MTLKMNDKWKEFRVGQVVEWSGNLWIVGGHRDKGLFLIDFNSSNITAYPTTTWPKPEYSVYTVKYKADSCKDYIDDLLQKASELI